MLFLAENLSDLGAWTSLFGAATRFPVENIQDPQAYRVWRSAVPIGETTDTLTLDLGATTSPGVPWYLVIYAHNLDADADIVVKGDPTDLSTPDFSVTVQPEDYTDGWVLLQIPADKAGFRYWSIELPNTGDDGPSQVGRVYLGPAQDTGSRGRPDYQGVGGDIVDPSPIDFSPGGQRFAERKKQFQEMDLDFSYLPESIQGVVRELYKALGTVDPLFLKISDTAPLDRVLYVNFDSKLPEKVKGWDGSSYIWSNRLHLKEAL